MATLSFLLFLSAAISCSASDSSSSSTSFIYAGCSQPKYPPNSPYESALESLLSSLANSASLASFCNFSSTSPPLDALSQCESDLPLPSCSSCLRSALSLLPSLCPSSISAAIQLRSCYLRYGNDSFISLPDTSLLFKTCSSSSPLPSSSDFLASRDSAFSALTAAGPTSFRVGAAAGVRAQAQCVGDLSAGDCSDCVRAAAAQVKASCGGAASGEAYLGKCYIRYYSDGAGRPFTYASGGGGGGGGGGDHGITAAAPFLFFFLVAFCFVEECACFAVFC